MLLFFEYRNISKLHKCMTLAVTKWKLQLLGNTPHSPPSCRMVPSMWPLSIPSGMPRIPRNAPCRGGTGSWRCMCYAHVLLREVVRRLTWKKLSEKRHFESCALWRCQLTTTPCLPPLRARHGQWPELWQICTRNNSRKPKCAKTSKPAAEF